MTKSLLEQVEENALYVAPCPACTRTPGLADTPSNQMGPGPNGRHKRGRWQGLERNSMPLCQFCRGKKVVFLNRICECGMPAVLYSTKEKVWSCGSELCIDHASWRLGKSTGSYSPSGAHSEIDYSGMGA